MGCAADRQVPRQRTDDLVIRPHGEGTLILDRRTDTAHYLPPEVARVWGACTGGKTVIEIASATGIDKQIAASAVDQLMTLDLLEVPAGIDRRKFFVRSALVGAGVLTVPVIETVVAAPAWAQGTVGTVNLIETCTPNKQAAAFGVALVGFRPNFTGYSFSATFASSPPGPNPVTGTFGMTNAAGAVTFSPVAIPFGFNDNLVTVTIYLNGAPVVTVQKIYPGCNSGTPSKYATTFDPPPMTGARTAPPTPKGPSSQPSPTP